ncbi:MAG: hypothetical protein ABJL99_04210 [Aliishimia sp.]
MTLTKAWMIKPTETENRSKVGYHGVTQDDRTRLGSTWGKGVLPEDVLPLQVAQYSGDVMPLTLRKGPAMAKLLCPSVCGM